MSSCKMLQEIKKRIESGTPADEAIPYSVDCSSLDDYIEILYYSLQVLPESRRRQEIQNKLNEVLNVRRADSKL